MAVTSESTTARHGDLISGARTTTRSAQTTAAVTFDPAQDIAGSHLLVSGVVPGVSLA